VDEKKCERRQQRRTLEELVYAIFYSYTFYVDAKGRRCEPEQAVDYLLALRDEFQAGGTKEH
jgi:capsule polysaccharide export protein KpsC/LpsZ